MSKKVIILGGIGKGEQIMDCLLDNRNTFGDKEYEVAGFLNDYSNEDISGYKVLGKLEDVSRFVEEGYYFSFGIHPIGKNYHIKQLFEKVNIPEKNLATIVSKRAFVSPTTIIEPGVVILPFVYISLHVRIGRCSLIMAQSIIGHNSVLGPCCFMAAGSILGSNVQLGYATSICLGATVLESCHLGNFSILGAGSMLLKNIPDGEVFVGNPAKYLKNISR